MSSLRTRPILNKEQKKAVDHKNGPLLIVAGAGTGKTTVIIERVLNLFKKKTIKPDNVLALTFTDKAAGEMVERLEKELTIGCITGSAGLEYHNARFSFNNEKLILVEHNLGYTSEKKDEAIFQVIRALTPGSPLMNICECSYNTITRKIKKCSVQKEKCKNFLPTTGD